MLHSYGGIIWPCCRNSDGWGDGCWHAHIMECWKAWCCQRTRGYTKELQDLCHEWEVESMHNLSIQTPLGTFGFFSCFSRGTLMICRCATSRVAVVNRVKKTAKFLLLSSSISFMVHFPRCSLAFCDALYGSWRVHFLTLQGTNKYPLPRHFWRWGSFCHSFPQICAFVPLEGLFSFVLCTGSQELPRRLFTDWGFLLVRLHTGVANALAVRGARSLFWRWERPRGIH